MAMIKKPHDLYFRSAMSNLELATRFFEKYLPLKIQRKLNFATLKLQNAHFIDDRLKESIVDILYFIKTRQEEAFYLLVEHQSCVDEKMPIRLHKYMLRILEHHIENLKESIAPIIYPLVYYNGKVSHTVPEIDFFKQFGRNEILAREIFFNPIKLVNLKDEEPQEMTCFAVMETAMKHIYAEDFSPYLRRLIPIINQLLNPTNEQFIIKTLKYIFTRATLMDIELVNHIGSYLEPTIPITIHF